MSVSRVVSFFTCFLCLAFFSTLLSAATVQVRVNTANDDAEERISDGNMYRDSSDLELGYDTYAGGLQIVGMRFQSVNIPQGATINSAYIEFEVDETDSRTTNVVIYGEDTDDASGFSNGRRNISRRTPTTATVNWSPSAWSSRNQKQQTPDISTIIQEIVDRGGWSANNDMALFVEPGSGCSNSNCQRTAESYDGERNAAPLLVVDYSEGGNLSGNLNVDNLFRAYISSSDSVQGSLIGSGNHWPTTETISASLTANQTYYLHIYAEDQGGVAGFLGDFSLSGGSHVFENGSASLTTNTANWRVSRTGWSNYSAVSGYGQNGVRPWNRRSGVDNNATWIWSSDSNGHNVNYFTTIIRPVSAYSVVSVHGACGLDNLLLVEFDASIDANALDLAYYSLSSGTIDSVTQHGSNKVILAVSGVTPGQNYTLTVNGSPHAVDFSGLTAHYFDQRNAGGSKVGYPTGILTGNEYLRKDSQINFSWNTSTPTIFPNVSGNNDRFSVRWKGYLVPAQEGDYEFRMYSDDGMRVNLDNSEIVRDWSNHAPRYSSASSTQTLSAGIGYPLEVEYFENTGRAYSWLQWRRNGGSWQNVPSANFSSCAVTGATPTPIVDFRMDESAWAGTADEVEDSSGNTNHARAQGGATTSTDAHLCRAGEFDGADDYILSSAAGAALRGTSSLSFWIKTTQRGNNTGWQAPGVAGVEQAGGADDIFWGWLDASGNIGISVGNDYSSKSTTRVNDGAYHHVVLTRDAVTGAYKIYIDGSLNRSGFIAAGIIGNSFSSIGRIEDTGGSPEYFQGKLDELKVFDSILNDAQVTSLYTETRPCGASQALAHYEFEQNVWNTAGTVIDDSSGNSNTGLSVGSAEAHADGRYCKGAYIPDNRNRATIDAINSQLDLDREVGNAGTIMLWYRAEQNWVGSGNRTLFDASSVVFRNWADKYFFLSKQNDGRLRFAFEDSADRDFNLYTSAQSFTAGTWVHVAVTWDLANDNAKVYVNGSEALNRTVNSNGIMGDLGDLYFGDNASSYGAPGRSAYGRLDDIRVYDSELSAADITTAMNDATTCSTCALGGFSVTQPSTALACPSTRATVNLQAMCADGVTPKTDYAGTINLSSNENAVSEFYSAASGGSALSSITLTGSELGAANVYLFHKNENANLLVTAEDDASGQSGTASSGTDVRAQGFLVGSPSNFVCGSNTQQISLTAYGQTQDGSAQCAVITGFSGSKNLYSWFTLNYDPEESPEVADTPNQGLLMGASIVNASARPASTNLSLNFSNGVATTGIGYGDTAHILGVNFAHDAGVAGVPELSGNTTDFVVYPAGISLAAQGTDNACATNDHNCTDFVAAGADFTLQASAVCNGGTTAQSYISPSSNDVLLSANLVAPVGGDNAGLGVTSVGFASADNGVVNVTQQVSEVGVFSITASAPDYFSQAISDLTSASIGRFIPARFDLTLTSGDFSPSCSVATPFTYMNESFTWNTTPQLTIQAVNASGGVTRNYEGDFWMLGSSLAQDVNCGGGAGVRGFCYNDNAGTAASLSAPNVAISYGDVSNANGQRTISLSHGGFTNFAYNRPVGTNIVPFQADIDLDVRLRDDDLVAGTLSLNNMSFTGSAELRQGRWKMENTYGPETQALQMPAYSQFYNASSNFVLNSDDQCTVISATGPVTSGNNIAFGTGNSNFTVTSPLSDILGNNFNFSAPGAGNTGSADISVDLSAIPWLQFDWDGDGSLDDHPDVTVQFGQFRGHDRIIYWREVIQ